MNRSYLSFNGQSTHNHDQDPNQAIMAAPDPKEIFSLTGPSFLTDVDWNNSQHRSSVSASLVQGVYCLESDRRGNRQGPNSVAPPWWQFFNFKLIQVLVDNQDGSFFGAIYELDAPPPDHDHDASAKTPQRYVMAFRGTINKGKKEQDHRLNLQLIINNLHNSPRFQIALDFATRLIHHGSLWLTGHALGSSIALLLGKQMVKSGFHLETYLFNPPFASPHIERIKNDKLKLGLRFANSVLTAGIAAAVSPKKKEAAAASDPFAVLSTWVPYLFINSSDPICSEYVGYFKHREDMETMGPTARKIGRLATKHSIRDIFAVARGKTDSEAVHLIPSAYLTINANANTNTNTAASVNFRDAHAIHQWWRQDLQFDYKYYQYKLHESL